MESAELKLVLKQEVKSMRHGNQSQQISYCPWMTSEFFPGQSRGAVKSISMLFPGGVNDGLRRLTILRLG